MNILKYHCSKTEIAQSILALILLVVISACAEAPEEPVNPAIVNISGMWNYQQNTFDAVANDFVTTHFHVGLEDDGNTVTLEHCNQDANVIFTRTNESLINNQAQELKIIDADTIETVSVPDVWRLTKIDPKIDHFRNAGSVSLSSDNIPALNFTASQQVCAQHIVREGSNNLHFKVTIPFQLTYIDIEILVDDLSLSTDNISSMTISSPAFRSPDFYGMETIEALNGHVTVYEMTSTKVLLNFEFNQKLLTVFTGDRIQGTIDVHW